MKQADAVGLIAGGGDLPLCFLRAAAARKIKTVVFGIKGEAGDEVRSLASVFYSIPMTNLSAILKYAKKENIRQLMLLGYVRHTDIFKNISFDLRTLKVLTGLKNLSADSIMASVFREFESEGLKVMPSTYLMEDALAAKGLIAGKKPSAKQLSDIEFGFKMARGLASLDIGQTVVVRNGIIASAEAQEGTDAAIERGANIAGKGFIVVKTARPKQDLRYDVPVIGAKTVELVRRLGGAGIAVEAGRTFVLDADTIKKTASGRLFVFGAGNNK